MTTQDRWGPVAAQIGGAWDKIIDRGIDAWAALAGSDYPDENRDSAPCGFARVHLFPEDPSTGGVIAGLRAGSFWSDHGHIPDQLTFTLTTDGLALPLTPGETARIPGDRVLQLNLMLKRGSGAENDNLVVELIGNGLSGKPELLDRQELAPNQNNLQWEFSNLKHGADGQSACFRVRIRKPLGGSPDLLAYTNPIRVQYGS